MPVTLPRGVPRELDLRIGTLHIERDSIIVLSYSSNGYPDREELGRLLRKYKSNVSAYEKPHPYHFGTHDGVERAEVDEYLIVGR